MRRSLTRSPRRSSTVSGRAVYEASRVTASEDFSLIPDAFGVPYTYWTAGSVDPARYRDAVSRGAVSQEARADHSPHFVPMEESTLFTATRAQVVAALASLGAERRGRIEGERAAVENDDEYDDDERTGSAQ